MTDIIWGDPIPVDGKRPDWLRDDEHVMFDGIAMPTKMWRFDSVTLHPYLLPADHPYYTVQRHNAQNGTNFTYWPGGEDAPDDWDGGNVLFRNGSEIKKAVSWLHPWQRGDQPTTEFDIIGYTRRAEPLARTDGPAQWAIDRAFDFINSESVSDSLRAFARYIEQHEQPPVDPDILAVREILAVFLETEADAVDLGNPYIGEILRSGEVDGREDFCAALAAYRKHRQ